MKIISFAAIKGGVGKTSLIYQWANRLAKEDSQKVLLIDLDHQCNLTQTYDIYDHENTVANVFLNKGDVTIHSVDDNIDLIAGYMKLDDLERSIQREKFKNVLIYHWFEKNINTYNLEQYDYILFDCHPDFSTATKNAIIVSHAVISPLTPSEYGYQAKFNLEARIKGLEIIEENLDFNGNPVKQEEKIIKNFDTSDIEITSELLFVGNKIKHNTNSSRELQPILNEDSRVVGQIPDKELLNRSTIEKVPLCDMKKDKKLYCTHRKFFDALDTTFDHMKEVIEAID